MACFKSICTTPAFVAARSVIPAAAQFQKLLLPMQVEPAFGQLAGGLFFPLGRRVEPQLLADGQHVPVGDQGHRPVFGMP